MKLGKRIVARRQRKTRERYLRERARQEALQGQDVEQAIRDATRQSAGNTQTGQ